MRFTCLIPLLVLVAGCATNWRPAMPNAHKYEGSQQARSIYLQAFGDGFQHGWRMVTTDMTPWDLVYTNANPVLQSAGLDGFGDGERAAWQARTTYEKERIKKGTK